MTEIRQIQWWEACIATRSMSANLNAATCRWATPTLFLPAPFWFEAEMRPWTCVRDASPHVLDTTEVCAACARWGSRATPAAPEGEQPR